MHDAAAVVQHYDWFTLLDVGTKPLVGARVTVRVQEALSAALLDIELCAHRARKRAVPLSGGHRSAFSTGEYAGALG